MYHNELSFKEMFLAFKFAVMFFSIWVSLIVLLNVVGLIFGWIPAKYITDHYMFKSLLSKKELENA